MNTNFPVALAFVWRPEFDAPSQGVHTTKHDPGGLTSGGVIQATWDASVRAGIVKGNLADARPEQLSAVLRVAAWGVICDDLPAGLDLMFFNGRMMSGKYPWLVQQCLGFMADDVDGWIGPETLAAVKACDRGTLIDAISGVHAAYLATLTTWGEFGRGWTARLKAARLAAIALAEERAGEAGSSGAIA